MAKADKKSIIITYVFFLLICSPTTAKTQEHSLWEDLGLYGGQITSIALDPQDGSILYAGSWGGDGLFKSIDSGTSWQNIPSSNPSWFRNWEVNDIALDPHNPAVIWVAYNRYVDVSYDNGDSWKTFFFASEENRFCYTVAVDPHDTSGNTVYVGTGGPNYTNEFGELFITTDGGATWDMMNFITGNNVWNNFWHISFNPNQAGEVWVANRKSHLSPDGFIYMTDNYGENWWYWTHAWWTDGELYPFGYLDEVLVHPLNPLLIFASDEYGVLRKSDGPNPATGWHWSGLGQSCRALCIPPSAPDILYAGLIDEVAKSTDSGETFEIFHEAPSEFLALEADPFNADIVYAASINSGIYKSLDGVRSWDSINNGIRANAIFTTDLSPGDASTIICGTLAGIYLTAPNEGWKLLIDSRADAVIFHPEKTNTIYAGFSWKIGKSIDGGSTWSFVFTDEQYESNGISALALLPQTDNDTIIFAGVAYDSGEKGEILKLNDTGNDFSELTFESILVTPVPVNTVKIDHLNSDILFAGTGSFFAPVTPGGIYKSTDRGKNWTKISLRDVVVNSIAISPHNPDILYAGCGGSNADNFAILKSTNGGRTWENKTNGLPAKFSASDIQVDSQNGNIVYAALYKGFDNEYRNLGGTYITLDGGNYWTQVGLSDYRLYDINSSVTALEEQTPNPKTANKTGLPLPSSRIIAGTASGLFKSTTAGSGIITGSIFSRDSGSLVDEAVISSYNGSNCISVDGYYMLLVPAGNHTLLVQSSGHAQASVTGITVSAGQSVTRDIVMTPVDTSNNTNCLASSLLKETLYQEHFTLLRHFRDRVLNKTAFGKRMVTLYYNLGNDILSVLQKQPALKNRSLKLLKKSIPFIAKSVAHNTPAPMVLQSLLNETSGLLMDLEQVSPPALKSQLNDLRTAMKKISIQTLLKSQKVINVVSDG